MKESFWKPGRKSWVNLLRFVLFIAVVGIMAQMRSGTIHW